MFISAEAAVALANAKNRLQIVRAGQAWLLCPYKPGARFCTMHWIPSLSKSLPHTEDGCEWCRYPEIPKCHVPALVFHRVQQLQAAKTFDLAEGADHGAGVWSQRIVELTANTFTAFLGDSKPDQLAIVYRDAGRHNGPLHLRWLKGTLRNVPPGIAHLSVEQLLPMILHGTAVDAARVALDTSGKRRTKHKIYDRTDSNDSADCDARERTPEMPRGKGGAA